MKLVNLIITLVVVVLGAGAVYFVSQGGFDGVRERFGIGANDQGHEHDEGDEHGQAPGADYPRGPHGGRLLESSAFDLEITIFEPDIPPQFRVYAYRDGNPAPPGEFDLTIALDRHGERVDTIEFVADGDFLRGIQVVEEPHSFDVAVSAVSGEVRQQWTYSSYEGRVDISDEAAEFSGLVVENAGPAEIRSTFTLPGEVKLNADRLVHVVPRLAGVVRAVHKNLGDPVAEGDLLVVIESRELADAKSLHLAAREHLEIARKRFTREKNLLERKISSEEDYFVAHEDFAEAEIAFRTTEQKLMSLGFTRERIAEIAEDTESILTEYQIRAPIAGVVIEKHVTVGEAVAENTDIFLLADLATVWVEAVVHPRDLGQIRVGQDTVVRSDDFTFEAPGKVSYIGPLVGEATRTATAIMETPNNDGRWKPGLFVSVDVVESVADVPVAVRPDAIQTFRDWSVVYVKHGNTYEIAPVTLGRTDGEWIEVLEGLDAGAEYVTGNSFVVKAEIGKSGATHDH